MFITGAHIHGGIQWMYVRTCVPVCTDGALVRTFNQDSWIQDTGTFFGHFPQNKPVPHPKFPHLTDRLTAIELAPTGSTAPHVRVSLVSRLTCLSECLDLGRRGVLVFLGMLWSKNCYDIYDDCTATNIVTEKTEKINGNEA